MDGDISPELFQLSEPAAVDRRSRTIGLVSSAVAAIGSFLPWASVGPFTVNGTSGDGVITLVIAAVAAVFAFRLPKGRGARMVTLMLLTAEQISLLNENPHMRERSADEYKRLKKNLAAVHGLSSRYEEQRQLIEGVKTEAELANPDELLANTRRLTIHLDKDIEHEERRLGELGVKASQPPGA